MAYRKRKGFIGGEDVFKIEADTGLTLVVAFKCASAAGEGILVSSDSRATTELGLMTTVQKIVPIVLDEKPLAVAAGAGDAAIVKYAIGEAGNRLKDWAKNKWNGHSATTLEDFAQAVKDIEHGLVEHFSYLRSKGIRISMSMILACVTRKGEAALYVFDDRGLATPAHDSPGFVCIGIGFVTGGSLLLRQLYTDKLNVDEGETLAAYIIDQVSKVDTNVGSFEGEAYYFRVEKGDIVLGPLTREGFDSYKRDASEREKLIRDVWIASHTIGPARLQKIIERSVERARRRRGPKVASPAPVRES
jgi:20S proteasome alpha/beta subunit